MIITEKIDGTNAQVYISDDGQVYAGSRTRWITPEDDNFGFAKWVEANKEDLLKLGPGSHFGEWWGAGIQRKYGLTEKRFSLFNTSRWGPQPRCAKPTPPRGKYNEVLHCGLAAGHTGECTGMGGSAAALLEVQHRPRCCHVVPELYRGVMDQDAIARQISDLRSCGSVAAPGFMKPEGIVIYHHASGQLFKKTLEKDESPKGLFEAARQAPSSFLVGGPGE